MEVNRPSQKKQSSRKGKRAWRKNIDLDDIEVGLEERREQIRTLGESAESMDSNALFQIDTAGDEALKTKKAIKPYKVTKSSEILAQRSKAPGLDHYHSKTSNKIDGVKKKDVHRLMKLAGRVQGESKIKTRVEKDGLVNTNAYDVWGDDDEVKKLTKRQKRYEEKKPDFLKTSSSMSVTKPTHAPKTISHAPLVVREVEQLPDAGKSYNPSLESWKELIQKEYVTEQEKEDKRLELEAHKAKIQHLIETLDDNEESDSEDDDVQDNDDDVEKADSDEEDDEGLGLSLNKPVEVKKKTKHQRNREKRHQQKMALEQELKGLKTQIKELQKLQVYQKEVSEKEASKKEANFDHVKDLVKKKHRLGTKYVVTDGPLEVKLSDELTDSLRKLKTEGNLFYDNMKKLQSQGKVETRVPTKQGRKYKPKITEKWTYKDFK
ncbi:CYFA0S14e01222g1_1 [Cyberlindnera fabianii]|uniref:Ribosome biogenesis protein NOP53 n=1 Tax=Cyberlindnera fabianii TaxID=36022 RepID=A0A061BBC5_CYBFA|nr:Ribosome biogenesis protein NOP53 [Cyberlindnera fabianii]CDR44242.1 CYFA0S14e01222g1_1 [Cyberlindnera fabianii]